MLADLSGGTTSVVPSRAWSSEVSRLADGAHRSRRLVFRPRRIRCAARQRSGRFVDRDERVEAMADGLRVFAVGNGVSAMRKVVAAEYVTVDGVMTDPGGVGEIERGGWSSAYFNDELAEYQSEQLFASDALLLGRVTFEGFAAAWPSMEETEGEFAVRMNTLPKFVASRSLHEPLPWNGTLLKGDLADAVAKLKEQPGQDILIYGSGQLVEVLHARGLIDEYRLMVFPVTLGDGKHLFREGTKADLKLTDTKTTGTGVLMLTYEPAS
jgi:dihydrofolate reductase